MYLSYERHDTYCLRVDYAMRTFLRELGPRRLGPVLPLSACSRDAQVSRMRFYTALKTFTTQYSAKYLFIKFIVGYPQYQPYVYIYTCRHFCGWVWDNGTCCNCHYAEKADRSI